MSFGEGGPLVFGEDDEAVLLLPDELSLVDDESPAAFFSLFSLFSLFSPSFFDSDLASLSLDDVEDAEFDRPPA